MANVILVDSNDAPIGAMEKLEAHQKGALHRAFSIFIFNEKKQFLLQKRANGKYHSAGLWTNTCCSHPSPKEAIIISAQNRLIEEMSISTNLVPIFSFTYKAALENGLTEHELDHVFIGYFNQSPVINPVEVSDWKYATLEEINEEINDHPESYTHWFKEIYKRVFKHI